LAKLKISMEKELNDLWRGLQNACERKDIFWVLFYAHQLTEKWAIYRASMLVQEPVIEA